MKKGWENSLLSQSEHNSVDVLFDADVATSAVS